MRSARMVAATGVILALSSATAVAARPTRVTPAGWRVAPAGREIAVSKMAAGFQGPMGAALSPNGRQLLAVSSGASRWESADLFDLRAGTRTAAQLYDAMLVPRGQSAFYGVAFAPDGGRAWVSGGGENVVHVLDVTGSTVQAAGDIVAPYFPAGLAYGVTPNGPRLYVANNLASDPAGGANPPGHEVTVIDPATGAVLKRIELGAALHPLGVAFASGGTKAYVTEWMGRRVAVIDTASETLVGHIRLHPNPLRADHPSAVTANPRRPEIYTANANSDTVSVVNTRREQVVATIPVGLVPRGPKGASPVGIAASPNGRRLYVALAGENAVAVVDVRRRRALGFIPTSWYPADVEVTPNGRRIVITNLNDSGAGPNPCAPLSPLATCPSPRSDVVPEDQYAGTIIKGSVTVVRVPRARTLARMTARVRRNNQAHARAQARPAVVDKIKHVIYVIKENRTYDQVLGDLPRGNGDSSLTLFGPASAPNHHALARRFGIYDNFYADAEVSADGHNWITQANATDYVDKMWPIGYSPRPRSGQRAYDLEDVPLAQQFPMESLPQDPAIPRSAAAQTAGYLWDNADAHGLSYRSYGEYTKYLGFLPTCPTSGNTSDTTHLHGRTDEAFPGYHLKCADHVERFQEWKREFALYVSHGRLPALSFVRLPNDHTNGTVAGSATPEAYMADNDLALGRLVETVSRSPYWKNTAIFVTEDDAQNGPDHVDAHRTLAYVISPYTRRGKVDSTHYDTASMIGTIEEVLGLPRMSIVDQRATRMWRLFRRRADLRPYRARIPAVIPFGQSGAPVNAPTAPMAREAAKWDMTREDATPEVALNEAIWKSIRGRHSRMPRPRHDRIIGSVPNDEDAAD